jgi:hypothetical protein
LTVSQNKFFRKSLFHAGYSPVRDPRQRTNRPFYNVSEHLKTRMAKRIAGFCCFTGFYDKPLNRNQMVIFLL